jgi:hypothetical protein
MKSEGRKATTGERKYLSARRKVKAIEGLLKLRSKKVSVNDAQIRAARKYGRP